MKSNEEMIQELIHGGVLKTSRIIDAFRAIDRKNFVRQETANEAYENYPLPIGEGQTISQPYTVAFMLELIGPKTGMHIVDIGSGSGWQTALLSEIVGREGKIYAIERIPALCEFAKKNLESYGMLHNGRVEFLCSDASSFLPENSYDAIIAGASANKAIPSLWQEMIKIGGKIVAPVGESIWLFTKKSETEWDEKEFAGFIFVPLVQNAMPHSPLPPDSTKKDGELKKKFWLWCSVFFLLFSIFSLWEVYVRVPNYSNKKTVEIPKGMGMRDIASLLKEKGIIRSEMFFLLYTFFKKDAPRMQAGTYAFSPISLSQVEKEIVKGGNVVELVIPEGWTREEIESYTRKEAISNPDKFRLLTGVEGVALFKEKFTFLGLLPAGASIEGFLFPDTYKIIKTVLAQDLVTDILQNFDIKLSKGLRREIMHQGKTIYQIVIMASLIEKEVARDEDRKIVAGILWKRLSLEIPLQVDATISYIKKQNGSISSSRGKISLTDTKIDSPYNTYKYKGLPAGPIGNPGMSAIRAAIYPSSSPYFFYLSTPEGKTIFSETLEEHNKAKDKYLR